MLDLSVACGKMQPRKLAAGLERAPRRSQGHLRPSIDLFSRSAPIKGLCLLLVGVKQ